MIKCFSSDNANIVYESVLSESSLMKRLASPYIPAVHDIIHNDKDVYIVMDYVDGITLQRMIEQRGHLEEPEVLHIAKELCRALAYLHSLDPPIIFRDVKPGNIMIQPNDDIKLIDFGIAKELTADINTDTTALGTRGYASPEHFGGLTDQRSDIYSFGMTIRAALTGENPCNPWEWNQAREEDDRMSAGFEYVLEKCTQIAPDDRYQNCGELLRDLENIYKLKKPRSRKQKQHQKKQQEPTYGNGQISFRPQAPLPRIDTSQLWSENTVLLTPEPGQTTSLRGDTSQSSAGFPPVSGSDLSLLDDIKGNYVFISYAHRDGQNALRIIRLLQSKGVKIWYDNGIHAGSEWRAELESRIKNCGYFISLISPNYFKSKNCSRELNYAADRLDNILMIYLEKTQLPVGYEMYHNEIQAIYQYRYCDEEFMGRLFRAKGLNRSFFKDSNEFEPENGQTDDVDEDENVRTKEVFVAYDTSDYLKYARRFIELLENADVNVWHKLKSCTDINDYQRAAEAEFGSCDCFVFFLSETLLNDEAERNLLSDALEKAASKDDLIGVITNGNPQIYAEYFRKMTIISSDSGKAVNAAAEMILCE